FVAKVLKSDAKDLTLNQRVQGSSPCAPTIDPLHIFSFELAVWMSLCAALRRAGGIIIAASCRAFSAG
ncbi:MAG: hypothetical protein WA905_17960, partial [Pseudolabrys sp.]